MTMAEGLVMMWLADALEDMAQGLESQAKGKTITAAVERREVDGRPVLRLCIAEGGTVRIEIVEEGRAPA